MDSIFKGLLKTIAKIADNITRALRLKGVHGASVSEKVLAFISLFYISFVSFTNRILGISSVVSFCLSPYHPRGSSSLSASV